MLNHTINNTGLHYKKSIETTTSTKHVFLALNEGLNLWWGNISNSNFETGGQFTITFDNGYWWTFKILEYTPDKELVWKCMDGEPEFNKEWIGHVLHWRIEEKDKKTILSFHHIGLTPSIECYTVCSTTWDMFITKKLKTHLG